MAVAEIIIACMAVSMLLMCCITCFILYVYHKTSSRLRRASRGRTPKQVQQLPPSVEDPAPPVAVVPPVAVTTSSEADGKKIDGFQKISTPAAEKRPAGLRIDTNKVCPAQSAIAMETDYSADSFLASMTKDTVNRRRLLQDEFLVLSRTEARRLTRSTERATRHPAANRYSDIVPYDHTLVELDTGDYINASFVQGETDALRWIATQAPIDAGEMVGKETVSDFWQMIVQYDVACIVMLGQHQEDFVQKCGEYWPTSMGKTTRYGSVEVKIVCELEEKAWVHREFDVSPTPSYFSRSTKNSRKSRTSSVANHMKVSHWQYKEWKDSDTPRLSTFLEFLLQVRGRQYTSPVVVHCSAGIGRTGVFICTDNVISRLESEGIIDIFSEVNRSRQQRPSMVHTVKQYECIYNTIGEYLRQQQQQKK
ncbi:hypothetical protein L3Y34_014225 [Caenorhabditis briggsae]|uniref:Uncharacterized protein n=3 Tax=Caenorhabditis briggsae TaxID=6238 RepID=A0AAE9DSB9_CAEBR|nr:hypothetical protein L3Y34_014225 [Caenorhabditis briggsae]